jgi:hypothetical protein
MSIDLGIFITVALAVIGAWWAIAVIAIKQFEQRQNEKFTALDQNLLRQKEELDGHLARQDFAMSEIRRIESELGRSQVEAASRFQTKVDAASQHNQILEAIRELGKRLDALFGNGFGRTQ